MSSSCSLTENNTNRFILSVTKTELRKWFRFLLFARTITQGFYHIQDCKITLGNTYPTASCAEVPSFSSCRGDRGAWAQHRKFRWLSSKAFA